MSKHLLLLAVTVALATARAPAARAADPEDGPEAPRGAGDVPAPPGLPRDEEVCPVDGDLVDTVAWLRAVSLDVRGAPPTLEELQAVASNDAAAETAALALLDEWLASDGFVDRTLRRHRELLWNSLGGVDLINFRVTVRARAADGIFSQDNDSSRRVLRGDTTLSCKNEPATFEADGSVHVDADGREGYVEVHPYWAPDTTVRVCALDAQTRPIGDSGARCGTAQGLADPGCGCGEGLRFCVTATTELQIRDSLVKDLELRIRHNIESEGSYLDLFTERRAFVNGPLAFFWRNMSEISQAPSATPVPLPLASLPDLPFAAVDDWREIDPGAGHSGLLTSPAFLLRFQTNRARANRFFNAFLCQPFQPPSDGIDLSDPAAVREPDLQARNGCKYCHALLEPAAAHWSRFVEVGSGYLDPALFPRTRPDCDACAHTGSGCSAECTTFYVTKATTDKERAYLGQLKGFLFRNPEHDQNVDDGPRRLVLASVVDGKLPRCVARSTSEALFGRRLRADEEDALQALADDFVASGFSYRGLVRAVVTSPTYRRVR